MKTLILALAALVSLTASAELYYATVNTGAFGGDTSHDKTTSYSGYLCTAESAQTLFGNRSTLEEQTAYFAANFATVLGSLDTSAAATLSSDPVGYLAGQYSVTAYAGEAFVGDYLAVVLYSYGTDHAFRLFGANSAETIGGGLVFDDYGNTGAQTGSFSAWTAIPEPTSGLLLILGLAGLALRRKPRLATF